MIGGAGFIGSHLVDRLLAEEHEVDVIDDLSTGSLANLADARAASGARHRWIAEDPPHRRSRRPRPTRLFGMRRPELVYQLALLPRADRSPRAQGRGFDAALATMEAARRHGVAKVVTAVPASALHGQPAAAALPVKEGEIAPRGVRGVVARAVIDLMSTYRERDMIEFTALALASVYGPRQPAGGGVVAAFLAAQSGAVPPCFEGDGRQTRDFVFIDDVVDALVRAGERGSGLVINIGTGVQTTLRDLWAEVSGGAGRAARGRRGARPTTCPGSPSRRCGPGSISDGRRGRHSATDWPGPATEASVVSASCRAISGVDITDGVTTQRIPVRSTSPVEMGVERVDHEDRRDRCVHPGDADDAGLVAEFEEHPVRRPLRARRHRRSGRRRRRRRAGLRAGRRRRRAIGADRSTRLGSTERSRSMSALCSAVDGGRRQAGVRRRIELRTPEPSGAGGRSSPGTTRRARHRPRRDPRVTDTIVEQRSSDIGTSRIGTSHARRISSVTWVSVAPSARRAVR